MNEKKDEVGWSNKALLFSLIAAFFGALYLANDTFVMHRLITHQDQFTAVSVYLVLGSWVIMASTLVYNVVFGRHLDKGYKGFSLGNKKMQFYSVLCGIIGAVSTIFCVMGNQQLDSSLVTSLSNVAILYVAFYDAASKRIMLKEILLPVILVIGGAFLASMTNFSGGFKISWLGIVILVVLRSSTNAADIVCRQKGVMESDSITFNLWRSLWFVLSATIIILTTEILRGRFGDFCELITKTASSGTAWFFISLTGLLVFFCFVYMNKAMQFGAASKVCIVTGAEIAFGIPVILIANLLWQGALGEIPNDTFVWICRVAGAVAIGYGIYRIKRKRKDLDLKKKPA